MIKKRGVPYAGNTPFFDDIYFTSISLQGCWYSVILSLQWDGCNVGAELLAALNAAVVSIAVVDAAIQP